MSERDDELKERDFELERQGISVVDDYSSPPPPAPADIQQKRPTTGEESGVVFSEGEVLSVYDSRPINAQDFISSNTATLNVQPA